MSNRVRIMNEDAAKSNLLGGRRAFADFCGILADKSIDRVIIATPGRWHAYMAVESAHAGKGVYCGKSLAHNPLN